MIEYDVYEIALGIVRQYHKQVFDEAIIVEEKLKQIFGSLPQVETHDFVRCEFVHSASTKHLTKGKDYEVLNTDDYRFLIKCDSGVKKWYYKNNLHFKLLINKPV